MEDKKIGDKILDFMDKEEKKKGLLYYIFGFVIVILYIWMIIAGSDGRSHGCYEDQYGNETCYEDPRN